MARMRSAVHEVRTDGERDRGMTLTELLVSMLIFSGLIAIVFGILIQVMNQTRDSVARERQVQELRIAMMQIDRQVRSGNVISDPASETIASSGVDPGFSLRVYTQTDGNFQCVQWRVIFDDPTDEFGELQFRTWKPEDITASATPWSVVARSIIRPASGGTPFAKSAASSLASGAQSVDVTLWTKDPEAAKRGKPAVVSTALTGRNTVFGSALGTECAVVPAP